MACEGGGYYNIKMAARRKDRAIFLSNLYCMATASDLGKDEGALYDKTGGCFKIFEVRALNFILFVFKFRFFCVTFATMARG